MWLGSLIGRILAFFLGKLAVSTVIVDRTEITIYVVKQLIPKWAVAQTWGRVVLIRPEYSRDSGILAHEREHVLQWQKYSIFFIPCYILFTIEAAIKHGPRQGYRENRFEKEARLMSGR